MLPKKLYHASSKKVSELKPGFLVSGKLVKWDSSESNRYLYALSDKDGVVELGLGSAIEKICLIDRYQVRGDEIIVHLSEGQNVPSMETIRGLDIYVYTIGPTPEQLWVKNNNRHNGLTNEWKTKSIIPSRCFTVEKIDVKKFLETKELRFELT